MTFWGRAVGFAAVLALVGSGCAPTPPPAAPAAPAPAPKLHEGPLADFVPAAGLRWIVLGRPKELASDKDLARALGLLLPPERLALFTRSSGVDLASTSEGLIAGFDHATLYMATTPASSTTAEERFAERLVAGPRIKTPHPRVRSITGVVGGTPETLVRVDGQWVAVSVGSSLPARIAGLYALGRLKKSASAFEGAALSTLPLAELEKAPARFYAPGPFTGEWAQGAHGLLSRALAAGIALRPGAEGHLSATVVVSGDFRSFPGDPAQAMRDAWQDLAESGLGRLLGLDAPTSPPVVSATPESVRLSVEVDPMPLAMGLRAAVMAQVWEILGLEGPPRAPEPPP